MIAQQVKIDGSGKGTGGWFTLRQADVSYDHPFHAPYEHALNIDFVDEAQGTGARVQWSSAWKQPARWWRRSRPCWPARIRGVSWSNEFRA